MATGPRTPSAPPPMTVVPAGRGQRRRLSQFLKDAGWLHQHLDWVDPLELLGGPLFLLAMAGDQAVGGLACPPDLPTFAWIRLFAASRDRSPARVWEKLWQQALDQARAIGLHRVAALLTGGWFQPILRGSGFDHRDDVVFLRWEAGAVEVLQDVGKLRLMGNRDLPAVAEVDVQAFEGIWRYSAQTLEQAYRQSAIATLIEVDGETVAFQISTATPYGAHLARLAVHPDWQGRGLGGALVADVQSRLAKRKVGRLSVNTQASNQRSLRLYQRLGFEQTGQIHPVLQIDLKP